MTENPGEDRQGVEVVFKLPQGINTHGVAKLPRGDKTPGMVTKGKGLPGEDGQGWGGDGNPPTNQATKDIGASGSNKDMACGIEGHYAFSINLELWSFTITLLLG